MQSVKDKQLRTPIFPKKHQEAVKDTHFFQSKSVKDTHFPHAEAVKDTHFSNQDQHKVS